VVIAMQSCWHVHFSPFPSLGLPAHTHRQDKYKRREREKKKK
jgi:hypothetical protein